MKKILLITTIVLLALAQTAEPFRLEQALTAKQAALGGTAFATNQSAYSVHTNPALLSRLKQTNLNLSMVLNNYSEDRKYPAYSAFNSRNGNEVYATSNFSVSNFNFALSHTFAVNKMGVTVAFSRSRVMMHDYNYRELIRQNNRNDTQIIAAQIWKVEGGIFANTLGVGTAFEKLNIGFALSLMTADEYKNNKAILLANEAQKKDYDEFAFADVHDSYSSTLNNSPMMLRFGATYRIFDQLTVGGTFASAYSFKMQGKNISDRDYMIPYQLGFGLEYYGSNELAAKFLFDFEYIAWSSFTKMEALQLEKNIYQDIIRYKFGMEHIVGKLSMPVRVGAIFENSKTDRDIKKTIFTLGSAINVSAISIDFSLSYGYLTYNEKDLFKESIWKDASGSRYTDRTGIDTIDQTFLSVMFDINYQF